MKRRRTADEPHTKARLFWEKANRYARAARANRDLGEYDPAVSNAIHAIINVVDAVSIHYVGSRSASGSHSDAVRVLLQVDALEPRVRDTLGKRLRALLQLKTLAQYEADPVGKDDAHGALLHMERALESVAELARSAGWQ